MPKILLTGSTGFIGRSLTKFLINSGVNLNVILRKKNNLMLNSLSEFAIGDLSLLSIDDLKELNEKYGFLLKQKECGQDYELIKY